ncbi:TIGR02206 family membrane protein [uncultured Winogradskyella sp.]|uniref:YwaF family protein n=1 Tax=uncultured Winogradskyella sp. TaxID=395353 RepID=UPI002605F178|nr:TIGR02206 family membrane protein [uncultured Winogradskyella sp.]
MLNSLILDSVSIGSKEHLLPIVIAILFATGLIIFSEYKLSYKYKTLVFKCLGIFVFLSVVSYHIFKIYEGDYNFRIDLPLFLCSFMAMVAPIFTFQRKYWMYEILFFWVIGGTTHGVITPDIPEGFPNPNYFRYWIVHMGLLTIIAYATVVLKMRPKFTSVFKSLIVLQGYIIVMMILNAILGSNYSYLNRKPNSASLLDYLDEWPYYILEVELMVIPYLLLIYLPFYFLNKKAKK